MPPNLFKLTIEKPILFLFSFIIDVLSASLDRDIGALFNVFSSKLLGPEWTSISFTNRVKYFLIGSDKTDIPVEAL